MEEYYFKEQFIKTLIEEGNQRAKQYNFLEALDCFNAASKLYPNDVHILINQAKTLVRLHRYSDAIKFYQKAIKIDPNNFRALNGLGFCLYRLNKHQISDAYFDFILQKNPDYFPTLLTQAEILKNKKEYKKSIGKFKDALQINQKSIRALLGIAQAFVQIADIPEAISHLKMVLQIDPHHLGAKKRLTSISKLTEFSQHKESTAEHLKTESLKEEKYLHLSIDEKSKPKKVFTLPGEESYEVAHELMTSCQYKKALPYLHKSAEEGYPLAYAALAKIYTFGAPGGVTQEPQIGIVWQKRVGREIRWLQTQSEKGCDRASEALGFLRSQGIGVRKDHTIAERWYQKAIQQNPNNMVAWINLGTVKIDLYRIKEGLEFLEKALQINPTHSVTLSNKALALSLLNQHESALKCIDHSLTIDPTHGHSLLTKAKIYCGLHLIDLALKTLKQLLELDPKNIFAMTLLADIQRVGIGDNAQALSIIQQALELNPNYSPAIRGHAVILDKIGLKEKALENYSHILSIDPSETSALYNKILLLLELNRKKEALECLTLMAGLINPMNFDHLTKWAQIQVNLNNPIEALNIVNAVIAMDPQCVIALNTKSMILHRLGETEEAIRNYQTVLAIDPINPIAWGSTALALSSIGESKRALENIEVAVDITPRNVNSLMQQAVILANMDRITPALDNLKIILEMEPGNITALLFSARLFQQLKNFKAALEAIQLVLLIDPINKKALHKQCDIKFEMGNLSEALVDVNAILERDPEDSHALWNKGKILHFQKNYKSAVDFYIKVFLKEPTSLGALCNYIICLIHLNRIEEALDRIEYFFSLSIKNSFEKYIYEKIMMQLSELDVACKLKRLADHKSKTTVMSFSRNSLKPEDVRFLIRQIEYHPTLSQLFLEDSHLTNEDLAQMERAVLKNKKLFVLDFTENKKFNKKTQDIHTRKAIQSNIKAYLCRNHILSREQVSHEIMQKLDLELLPPEDIKSIIKKHHYLDFIDFSKKNLHCHSPALQPTCLPVLSSLTYLNLSHNRLGGASKNIDRSDVIDLDKGIQLLANLLNEHYHLMPSLRKLSLGQNGIGKEGFLYLAEAMTPKSSLEILDLHSNFIGVTEKKLSEIIPLFKKNKNLQTVNLWGNALLPTCDVLLIETLQPQESKKEEIEQGKAEEKKLITQRIIPSLSTASIFYVEKPSPGKITLKSVLEPNCTVDKDNCLIVLACPKGYIWEQHSIILLEIMRPAKSQRCIYRYDFVTDSRLRGKGEVRREPWEVARAARSFQDKYDYYPYPKPRVSGDILNDNILQQIEDQKTTPFEYALSSGSLKSAMNCFDWCKRELSKVGIQVSGVLPRSAVQKKSGLVAYFKK